MKNNKKIMIVNGVMSLLLMLLFISSCQIPGEGPTKTVLTYTLTKLEKATTHNLDASDMRVIDSSGNGEFVYLVGNKAASLKSYDVDNNKWADALGDWTAVQQAANHGNTVDLSARKVVGFSTFLEGIVFTLDQVKSGLVLLKGTGANNSSYYPQGKGINFRKGEWVPFVVVNKNNNRYIVLTMKEGGGAAAANGLIFRKYVDPPTNDAVLNWDNTLGRKAPGIQLKNFFTARTVDDKGNLLLAVKGKGIERVKEEDIGEANKFLDNNGKVVYDSKEFMLDGKTKNDEVNVMALVDKKFLVLGLKSTDSDNGGVVVTDLTQKNLEWRRFGKGLALTVKNIATERIKNPDKTIIAATIVTNKGLLFLDKEGKIMELVEGKGPLVTTKFINDHRVEAKDYDNASSGFSGEKIADPSKQIKDIAQDKNGLWYLLFDDGLYTLDIKPSQVELTTVKPKLD